MQKPLIRRNIEETVLDNHMAVNMIAMCVRLLFLLGENKTVNIKDCVKDIRVKSLVWLITTELFNFSIFNVKSQLSVLKLAKIQIWDNFESSEYIIKNLFTLLKGNRTTSLKDLITLGIPSVISSVIRLIEPFKPPYFDEISMESMYNEIANESTKCYNCEREFFEHDLVLENATDNSLVDKSDICFFICYQCLDNDGKQYDMFGVV